MGSGPRKASRLFCIPFFFCQNLRLPRNLRRWELATCPLEKIQKSFRQSLHRRRIVRVGRMPPQFGPTGPSSQRSAAASSGNLRNRLAMVKPALPERPGACCDVVVSLWWMSRLWLAIRQQRTIMPRSSGYSLPAKKTKYPLTFSFSCRIILLFIQVRLRT